MKENNFERYRTDRRSRLSAMDTIIRNNEDFKESEKDVLIRGFIVLIYAFWEGNYKELQKVFFEDLKEKKIKDLPNSIKDKVIINLSSKSKQKDGKPNIQIIEVSQYKQLIEISSMIDRNLELSILETNKEEVLKKYFMEGSGNPDYDKLNGLLKKYDLSLRSITRKLKEYDFIKDDLKDRIKFIVKARNNIAHGFEDIGEYKTYEEFINDEFIKKEESTIVDVSNFLIETAFYIDLLYKEIYECFINKYMHK